MEGQEQLRKSKVIKIDSKPSWDTHISHASNQSLPVMVHFSASWCMPSVFMNPFFEELASTHQNMVFLMVDVDEVKIINYLLQNDSKFAFAESDHSLDSISKEVAWKMGIKAMPTFVLLSGGSVVHKIVGANPHEIRKRLGAFLHSTPPHNFL